MSACATQRHAQAKRTGDNVSTRSLAVQNVSPPLATAATGHQWVVLFNPPDRLPAPVRRFSLAARVVLQAMDGFFRRTIAPNLSRQHGGFGFLGRKTLSSCRCALLSSCPKKRRSRPSPIGRRWRIAPDAGQGDT
ncbi:MULTISPECIES: hypothetical protein [Xanthomonas]|uniref:Uncharacterized protein n=1 Tax=Xanthomonas dyei TaxID=743699 RepID=A0ABZ0D9X0_9XANT|nr:hypothetical protein [Xanthomonas dyei]WOB27010.1 hypothetical protein NYR99_03230 [Xanthomonas dyei]WOB54632.1 hypothetical protein NYR95_03235 [Xanthomonas dyei]